MGMNDPVEIVASYLRTAGTELYSLTGERIWSPVSPETWRNEQPGIIFHADGCMPETPRDVFVNTFVFKCYGGNDTYTMARTVAQALYNRLHGGHGTTPAGTLVRARCTLMVQGGADPNTGWPVHLVRFDTLTN